MLLYKKEKLLNAYRLILTHKMVYECAKTCYGDLKWSAGMRDLLGNRK